MNQDYVDTARLLLGHRTRCIPATSLRNEGWLGTEPFIQDMPRLSVDTDIVFTDHALDREAALRAISVDLAGASLQMFSGKRLYLSPTANG